MPYGLIVLLMLVIRGVGYCRVLAGLVEVVLPTGEGWLNQGIQ